MDQVIFNIIPTGRKFIIGTSLGGTYFKLFSNGKVVKSIKFGYGGDIHFIGANFGYSNLNNQQNQY